MTPLVVDLTSLVSLLQRSFAPGVLGVVDLTLNYF